MKKYFSYLSMALIAFVFASCGLIPAFPAALAFPAPTAFPPPPAAGFRDRPGSVPGASCFSDWPPACSCCCVTPSSWGYVCFLSFIPQEVKTSRTMAAHPALTICLLITVTPFLPLIRTGYIHHFVPPVLPLTIQAAGQGAPKQFNENRFCQMSVHA